MSHGEPTARRAFAVAYILIFVLRPVWVRRCCSGGEAARGSDGYPSASRMVRSSIFCVMSTL